MRRNIRQHRLELCLIASILLAAGLFLSARSAPNEVAADAVAGSLEFDATTDTIQVFGNTVLGTSSTYEVVLFQPSGTGDGQIFTGANGWIFNERGLAEAKQFYAGDTEAVAYNYRVGTTALDRTFSLSPDEWHHIAFVQDAADGQQRIYADGVLAAPPLDVAGDILDGPGGAFVGASLRPDGLIDGSFVGLMDSVRISDVARYTGTSFDPPIGDLADDDNAQLLYNFNAGDFTDNNGVIEVTDVSGNGNTGRLGQGFLNATSPSLPVGALPTATPATLVATEMPTNTDTPTNTPPSTSTPTDIATNTPTNMSTLTSTPTATNTPTNTATRTNTPTNTATATNTPSSTPTLTNTPTNTATVTNTPSSTPTRTNTPTNTATASNTSTSTPTNTTVPTNTATSTHTPTGTLPPTSTPTSTNPPTSTATHTSTPTSTNTPTSTATPTQTVSPTATVTATSAGTATNTPTQTSTLTPTRTHTATPTRTATRTPTVAPARGYLCADFDHDGGVTIRDVIDELRYLLQRQYVRAYDLNRDGRLTLQDLVIAASQLGRRC